MEKSLHRQIINLRERRNNFLAASLLGGCFGIQFIYENRWFSFFVHCLLSISGWGLVIYNIVLFFIDAAKSKSSNINDIVYSGSLTQFSIGLLILFFLMIWWAVDTLITYKKYNKEIKHITQQLLD
jgi:hypothetical protein